jgi:hypothetical protein
MNFFRGVCILVLVCTIVSCDAPRINQLDPASPAYNYSAVEGTIEGTVKAQSSQLPLEGVKVSWKDQNVVAVVQTNSNGNFSMPRLQRKNGFLYFEKEGYSKDSLLIQFNNSKIIRKDSMRLNANPKKSFYNLYTSVENIPPTYHRDSLIVIAGVTDDEGDVDSVMIQNKSINFYKKLQYSSSVQKYYGAFFSSDMNVTSIIETQGTSFDLVAVDKYKKSFVIGSSYLTRVITQEITCISPANSILLNLADPVVFVWIKFLPYFNFTYTLQVYKKNPDNEILLWEIKGISSADTGISTYNSNFKPTAGDYVWYLWAIDDFGNRTKSKPMNFSIK